MSGTDAGKILEGTATPSKGAKSTGTGSGSVRRKAAGKGAAGKNDAESWQSRVTVSETESVRLWMANAYSYSPLSCL